jgi:ASC-1-like (ASCH) protein
MEHVAIMKKSWNMIPKVLSGQKTIESRWYQTKRAPWGKVKPGDTVYFKNSGEPVTAKATVSKVLQYTLSDIRDIEEILRNYGHHICLPENTTWNPLPKYCILMFLENPQPIKKPFSINKEGFGNPAAWLCVEDIGSIKMLQ